MTKRTLILLSFLLLAVASRFIIMAGPQWANFSPMGALALFSGYFFKDKRFAIIYSLLSLWVSNLLLNNLLYSNYFKGFSWGFSGSQFFLFASLTFIGSFISKLKNNFRIILWVNFLVWAFSDEVVYSKDMSGLSACYFSAIPFFQNSLLSQLLFGTLFFGCLEWLKSRDKSLA